MSGVEPTLRPMRNVDMARIAKVILPKFVGFVVEQEGKDIGSGSIVWGDNDRVYLCLEISDELRQKPVFMVRVARLLIAAAQEAGVDLHSVESSKEPTATRFLTRLGFVDTGELKDGERVLRWRKSL